MAEHHFSWPVNMATHMQLALTLLEEQDIDCSATDQDGYTALHLAASSALDDVIKVLVQRLQCSVEIKDSCGQTPHREAALNNHTSAVEVLISKCKANVEACSNDGHTPLSLY